MARTEKSRRKGRQVGQLRKYRLPRVALLIETSNEYGRRLLLGIRDYVREHSAWSFHLGEQARGHTVPPWLSKWQGEGIIGRIDSKDIEQAIAKLGVPVVNVSAAGFGTCFPTVISDSESIAKAAADHLLECGFTAFGYCGDPRFAWSKSHEQHFVRYLQEKGFSCLCFSGSRSAAGHWGRALEELIGWVAQLPKPIGIMACYDLRGQQLLAACREAGIQVPDEIAVIGQHNDETICEFCDPPLSSVIPNPRLAGYLAASLLDQMLKGERVPGGVYRVPPIGVAARRSTDVVAAPDEDVSAAIRYIRDCACQGIDVGDLVQAVNVSRSMLERKFKRFLNCNPHDLIIRTRLRRAQELLTQTDLPMENVATLSGFSSAEYMCSVFHRLTGQPPREYRKVHRRKSV
ncbi:MAG: substrate-binding domain-containing protein [Thermogutta sp.]